MEWSEKWDAKTEADIKTKVNDVVNLALHRAEQAEAKTEEAVGLLAKLYDWCCGLNDFRPDAPLPRKIKALVGKRQPEVFTLLDNGQARIRSVMLDPQTMRLMVIDNRDGAHVAFTLTSEETGKLCSGLTKMWAPKDPLNDVGGDHG